MHYSTASNLWFSLVICYCLKHVYKRNSLVFHCTLVGNLLCIGWYFIVHWLVFYCTLVGNLLYIGWYFIVHWLVFYSTLFVFYFILVCISLFCLVPNVVCVVFLCLVYLSSVIWSMLSVLCFYALLAHDRTKINKA
jgi:hypothetical protein